MHADTTNRTVLTLVAVLLLAVGVAGALLGFGAFGTASAARSLLDNPVARFVGDYGAWFWPLAAVVGLFVALLALRWFQAIAFSTDRTGQLTIPGDSTGDRTLVAPGALTRAVVEEIEGYRGVHSAGGRVIGEPDAPCLVLDVLLEDTADLVAVRQRIQAEAVAHSRQAVGRPALPVTVNLAMTSKRESRVS